MTLSRNAWAGWRQTRLALSCVALLALAVQAATIERVPTPSADSDFYASIARSVERHDRGVPSVMRHSPAAVDHVAFYGPVFFDLAALSFRLFGMSIVSLRLVSALGTLLVVAAGVMLARQLSETRDRWLWAVVLLLMSPDLSATLTAGTMHTMAVGLELLALSVFVRGLATERAWLFHGATAGLLLVLAALTTPRTYPFILAFLAAGLLLPLMPSESRGRARRQWASAFIVLTAGICVWATASQGSPLNWARYMAAIFSHEDSDIALLPGAVRVWSFNWSAPMTASVAVGAMAVAAVAVGRTARHRPQARDGALAFGLLTGWMTFVGSVAIMNLTNVFRLYWVVPLFAVVLALPYRRLGVRPRLVVAGVAILIVCDAGVAAIRYGRAWATWSARDPAPLERFFRGHVPFGSTVIGPPSPYFMAVERGGASYRFIAAESWADWARWVPMVQPGAALARPAPAARAGQRFLVWSVDATVPDAYECARAHLVAVYEPPAQRAGWLVRFGSAVEFGGYPGSRLYRLPPDCPAGYDPSSGRRPSN